MNKTTTHEPMLKYLYNECSLAEKEAIEASMLLDSALYEEITEFGAVKKLIDESLLCPKISSLKKILAYSYCK